MNRRAFLVRLGAAVAGAVVLRQVAIEPVAPPCATVVRVYDYWQGTLLGEWWFSAEQTSFDITGLAPGTAYNWTIQNL